MSAVGGRLEIFEFGDLTATEKFLDDLWRDEEAIKSLKGEAEPHRS